MENYIQINSNNTKPSHGVSPKTKAIINICQGIGATLGVLSIVGAEIGRARGYITPEEANKLGGVGLLELLISASPTVYEKIQNNDFLEKISDDILDKSLGGFNF